MTETAPPSITEHRVSIEPSEAAHGASFLAVTLARPALPTDLCVLYCHGFASSQDGEKADYFRRRFNAFGVAMCSFDFRGHGRSGDTMLGLTLSRNLSDLEAVHDFVRAQGFRRFILFGSSMGGGVCTWYATRHTEEVLAAVHIAPGLEMEAGLRRMLGPEKIAQWAVDGTVLLEHALGHQELSWGLIEDLRAYDREQLATIYRTPTLMFQGVKDTSVAWRSVVDFAAACDAAVHVHLMADGDHRLVDRLDELWTLTHSFLTARGVLGGVAAPLPELPEVASRA